MMYSPGLLYDALTANEAGLSQNTHSPEDLESSTAAQMLLEGPTSLYSGKSYTLTQEATTGEGESA